MFGYVEVLTSSLAGISSSSFKFKPLLSFCVLALIFLLDLILATQGGIHVYHLLLIYNLPASFFSLLTVLTTVLSHGTNNLMRHIAKMTIDQALPAHWTTSHLSVIYTTVIPVLSTITRHHTANIKVTPNTMSKKGRLERDQLKTKSANAGNLLAHVSAE